MEWEVKAHLFGSDAGRFTEQHIVWVLEWHGKQLKFNSMGIENLLKVLETKLLNHFN